MKKLILLFALQLITLMSFAQSYIDPAIHIKNSSSTSMSLRINSTTYKLSPYETTTVTMVPGRFTFRVSAPGVVPRSGEYTIDSNYDYEWEFYIVTRRR